MNPFVRHETAPEPLGCRWCGWGERGHSNRWVPSKKWHPYEQPTGAQISARLRVRIERGTEAAT